tara:strand:- start:518 stop:1564 length:1047 start_codon:yes stop_codon:yes gene_type:complete
MKILISAAKTGGHVFPAISVGTELIKQGHEVIFLGSGAKIEMNALRGLDFTFYKVYMKGFRGKGTIQKIKSLFLLPLSILKSIQIMRKEKVDGMIGFGGFITIPPGIAAYLMQKPLFIHEQNSVMGSANRFLSKLTKLNFTGFAIDSSPNNSIITGNPIRDSFTYNYKNFIDSDEIINIYVTGGSQGADYINQNVPKCFYNLNQQVNIKHQCGVGNIDAVKESYKNIKAEVEIEEFYENPESIINWSDFVITRSGALSISEISTMRKGMLMIPLPSAIDNHQYINAMHIESMNMGVIHLEKNGLKDLIDKVSEIIHQKIYNDWKLEIDTDHKNAASIISAKTIEHLNK